MAGWNTSYLGAAQVSNCTVDIKSVVIESSQVVVLLDYLRQFIPLFL